MKMYKVFIIVLALAVSAKTHAQSIFNDLLSSTAKVMFIDSVVVDKNDFLHTIQLNSESGSILSYEDFFHKQPQIPCAVYLNEFNNRCFYAYGDTLTGTSLYSMDKIGGSWSEPKPLKEFGESFPDQNYPFLMTDGITLYFAAKGEHSLGGYDIFMTLFDSESGDFYKPENIGLPYNSTANDYLIAFNEVDTLGWLVSDRYQPAGKVCIYTFVPTFPRIGFQGENLSAGELKRIAELRSIKDTWGFGNREAAMKRLQAMRSNLERTQKKNASHFVINDRRVIYQPDDLLSPTAKKFYTQYLEVSEMLHKNKERIKQLREEYHNASADKRQKMSTSILKLEKDIAQQQKDCNSLIKKVRQAENSIIRK